MAKESITIESTNNVTLNARIFRPPISDHPQKTNIIALLVHPYSIMGGSQNLMKGIARNLVSLNETVFTAVITFDMRGVGRSTGKPSLTGFSEVDDVVSVCKWILAHFSPNRILLVGSSAGAPIAGSAVDKVEEVVGYVSLGYPFGFTASILFGRHHKAILQSPKPKLFVMGTKDGFTSVKQLENKLKSAAGRNETHLIQGASHFQMEGPDYDAQMAHLIAKFASSL